MQDYKITKIDNLNYDVNDYMVHLGRDSQQKDSCTCMSYTIHGGKDLFICKHIRMVKEHNAVST